MISSREKKIGVIGQGWIGSNYSNDLEKRDFVVTRYSLEEPYVSNKTRIAQCDIVFIAVPTPTTPKGFDDSRIAAVLPLVGRGKTAVIKSTILPGTTEKMQKLFPDIYVLHSPEFLVEKTAAYDAAHPKRNIVGLPIDNPLYYEKAEEVLHILPRAPYNKILGARSAELIKYAGNGFLFTKLMYINTLYDLTQKMGGNWEDVREALINDPRIGESHTEPVYDGGRGAGGDCFIKDLEALLMFYKEQVGNPHGTKMLEGMRDLNVSLLRESGKSIELLNGVYGHQADVPESEEKPRLSKKTA